MKKRTIIAENHQFKLVKQQRNHKIWYELQPLWHHISEPTSDEINEYFGVKGKTKSGFFSSTWRFWNRIEAEHKFTFATLKWGN